MGGAGGARVNSLPPPSTCFPLPPRAPGLTLVSLPPLAAAAAACCCHPPGRSVPLALPAAGLPGRPGREQACRLLTTQPPPPCWPLAHLNRGPHRAPAPAAPALTRYGVEAGREGPVGEGLGQRLLCGGAPGQRGGSEWQGFCMGERIDREKARWGEESAKDTLEGENSVIFG